MEKQKDNMIKILGVILFTGLILVIVWFLFYNTYSKKQPIGSRLIRFSHF